MSRISILTPYFKSPFTDFFNDVISAQWGGGPCADLELKALDCLEAYGFSKGLQQCQQQLKDFEECIMKIKQFKRLDAMEKERQRQYKSGERSKEEIYSKNPPVGADIY
ncbi:hypothetical protein ABEB36_007206 [Hypothenemus hampei]|uniref:NADH-ubiquinone oxidoreductase 15 kDa subunit n=1 Tax=Hypothenemus hampei TaxID=57062 RepID=A0ABD1ET75_HYPHA